jgi:hypothetical protein
MNTKILYFSIASLVVFSANCMEVDKASLMVPSSLGTLKVFHQNNEFSVEQNGTKEKVQSYNVSPLLRRMSQDQLCKFLARDGYIKVRSLRDRSGITEYALNDCGRIRGGGPFLAGFTFIAGGVATAAAAAAVTVAAAATGPIVLAPLAAVVTVKAGLAATTYASICVLSTPTP